jgi:hypothetical protein
MSGRRPSSARGQGSSFSSTTPRGGVGMGPPAARPSSATSTTRVAARTPAKSSSSSSSSGASPSYMRPTVARAVANADPFMAADLAATLTADRTSTRTRTSRDLSAEMTAAATQRHTTTTTTGSNATPRSNAPLTNTGQHRRSSSTQSLPSRIPVPTNPTPRQMQHAPSTSISSNTAAAAVIVESKQLVPSSSSLSSSSSSSSRNGRGNGQRGGGADDGFESDSSSQNGDMPDWLEESDVLTRTGMKRVVKHLNEKINRLYGWHLKGLELVGRQQLQLNNIRQEVQTVASVNSSLNSSMVLSSSVSPSPQSSPPSSHYHHSRTASTGSNGEIGMRTPSSHHGHANELPTSSSPSMLALSSLAMTPLPHESHRSGSGGVGSMNTSLVSSSSLDDDLTTIPATSAASSSGIPNDEGNITGAAWATQVSLPPIVQQWLGTLDDELSTARTSLTQLVHLSSDPTLEYVHHIRIVEAASRDCGLFDPFRLPEDVAALLPTLPQALVTHIRTNAMKLEEIKKTLKSFIALSYQVPISDMFVSINVQCATHWGFLLDDEIGTTV